MYLMWDLHYSHNTWLTFEVMLFWILSSEHVAIFCFINIFDNKAAKEDMSLFLSNAFMHVHQTVWNDSRLHPEGVRHQLPNLGMLY